jgi:hypothetical protein
MADNVNEQSDKPALPRLAYTMRETAEVLGCTYQTVYRLNKRKLLNSSTALRTKLFPRAEIERFLADTTPARIRGSSLPGAAALTVRGSGLPQG